MIIGQNQSYCMLKFDLYYLVIKSDYCQKRNSALSETSYSMNMELLENYDTPKVEVTVTIQE